MSAVISPNAPTGRALSPEPSLHPRLQVVIGIERTFLVARYIAYAALIGYYLLGDNPQAIPNILIITLGAIVHNTFVHWVLFRREYEWFLSPVNFFIHLAKVSLLVVVTGGEDSLVALFYLAVIIGYCIYSPRFTGTFRVTLAACLAYTLAL
ncbi:MAG: hypothetical protein HYZ00_10900, partial [Candidatus Hydrogenedentes bacterium]|nr:hypothetical protein [Candidatus Hydrogenedentota bacterium]